MKNLAQTPFLEELLADALKTQNSQFKIKHNDDYDSELTDYEEIDTKQNNKCKSKKETLSSSENDDEVEEDDDDDDNNQVNASNNKKITKQHVYHRSIRVDELNLTLKEPNGVLTSHLLNTIRSITNPTNAIVNPSLLFGSLCKKYDFFSLFYRL